MWPICGAGFFASWAAGAATAIAAARRTAVMGVAPVRGGAATIVRSEARAGGPRRARPTLHDRQRRRPPDGTATDPQPRLAGEHLRPVRPHPLREPRRRLDP